MNFMHLVDYILFLTADVDVTPNPNEIRDHKYVSKAELQAMFDDPGTLHPPLLSLASSADHISLSNIANSFTPWFKLIARDFLFGWWDELLSRKGSDGKVVAKNLAGIADGSKVIKMT
jgi:isopentenyl-diphosphate Delta-isomerase